MHAISATLQHFPRSNYGIRHGRGNGRSINNLRFADDIAVLAEKQEDLQRMINRIVTASANMGMKVNTAKTETQQIGSNITKIDIVIENQELKQVEHFVYLGGTMSEDASTEQDMTRRLGLACGAMQKLNPIWKSKDIATRTKTRVYESLVLNILMYNSETWALKEADKKKLRVF